MSRLLVIDTALDACTVVVAHDGAVVASRHEPMAKGHQERIAGLTRDVMAEAAAAGFGYDDLDGVGVTVGPGSFTGLRVGLAFAQGLGAALNRPVVGVTTLEALAASVAADGSVSAVIDARRGQVYVQSFREGRPVGEPQALAIATAAERMQSDEVLIGSGAALVAAAAGQAARVAGEVLTVPTPEGLVRAVAAAGRDRGPPRPRYLRAPDATPPTRLPGQPRARA